MSFLICLAPAETLTHCCHQAVTQRQQRCYVIELPLTGTVNVLIKNITTICSANNANVFFFSIFITC